MKLDTILVTDQDGNQNELPVKDYVKAIIEEYKIPDPCTFEDIGDVPAGKIVMSVFNASVNEKEVSEEIVNHDFGFGEMIERVNDDVKSTIEAIKAKKDEAAAEKERKKKEREEEKARKEKEAAELKERQSAFVQEVAKGADAAKDQFIEEIKSLKDSLPKGVTIAQSGNGFGIQLDEKVSDLALGQAVGYFYQSNENSQFLSNQIQFFIGDLAAAAVERGLFAKALDCAKQISEYLEQSGKRMGHVAIDTYRRMAERTPLELRNPTADPTAYLELSKMKRPRKGEDEKKEDFEKRKQKFEEEVNKVLEKLRDGEILTRKEVIPLRNEIEYETGMKERPDPEAPAPLSTVDVLRIYSLGKICLENVVSIDEEGEEVEDQIAFTHNKKVHWVSKDELRSMIEEAEQLIIEKFMTGKDLTSEHFFQGYKAEMKDVVIGTDPENPDKALTEKREVKVPVLLPAFFPIEEEETEEETEEEEKKPAKKAAKKAKK